MNINKIINKRILVSWILTGIFILLILPTNVISTPSLPAYIEKGDMMFMDIKDEYGNETNMFPGYSNDHVAMYLGENYSGGDDIFIEATPNGGVQTRSYASFFPYYENMTYYRVVNASDEEIDDAVDFTLEREDSDYQSTGIRKHADPENNDEWYCGELIWAGYYSASDGDVDIDVNDWSSFPWFVPAVPIGKPGLIEGRNDIVEDDHVINVLDLI
jgi:uncharacterized protein YycO